jgi:hypothetical protein
VRFENKNIVFQVHTMKKRVGLAPEIFFSEDLSLDRKTHCFQGDQIGRIANFRPMGDYCLVSVVSRN